MTVKLDTIYPHTGGRYYNVTYYSPDIINKEIAKIHKERLVQFLKDEKIRIKQQESEFKKKLLDGEKK